MRGFAPAPRATFVSAKVTKTIDAPSGLMRGDGRQLAESGPTRLAQTRSAGEKSVPPFAQTAGVGVLSYSIILSPFDFAQVRLREESVPSSTIVFVLKKGTDGCMRFVSASNNSQRDTNLSLTYSDDY